MSDDSAATDPNERRQGSAKDHSNVQFPWRLHELLSEAEANGKSEIISWLPDANAFKVHNKVRFTKEILPSYFNATKYKSFQRNLNLWGFETIQEGPSKGAAFHPLFIKGNREKCHYMNRQKVKGIMGKPGKAHGKGPSAMAPGTKVGPLSTLADLASQTNNPGLAAALRNAKASYLSADDLKALPFPKKLHHILAQNQYSDSICWTPDGRCVRVVDPFKFLEKVAKNYFSHKDFSSFLVELESYGFKKVSHVGFQECFYHDLMIRGCHHLCKYMMDPESSRRFVSDDPSRDLEIDQAFGVPTFTPPAPAVVSPPPTTMAPLNGGYMNDPVAAAAAQEFQQRQHFAALQFMNPLGLGLTVNPALLGGAGLGGRGGMPMLQMPGTGSVQDQVGSSTPISNYLANSSQGSNKVTGRSEAV